MKNVSIIITFVIPNIVYAVTPAGPGTVTYDPSVHTQLVTMYENAVKVYEATEKTLDRIDKMERTITRVYNSYERVANFDIEKTVDRFKKIGDRDKNGSFGDQVRQLRNNMAMARRGAASDKAFLEYNLASYNELERLAFLEEVAEENTKKSGAANPGQAQVLTSQNTSVMANFLADEAAYRQAEKQKEASSAKNQADLLSESGRAFSAFGEE